MSIQEENKVSVQKSALTEGRRSFIKKSAIAAPILVSISSRPVWGNVTSAVSGNLSGNLSQPTGNLFNGQSPGYWQGGGPNDDRIEALGLTYYDHSSSTYKAINRETHLKVIFPDAPAPYNTTKLKDILTGAGSLQQPSRYSTAAYFNTYYHYPNYPLTKEQIKSFYSIYAAAPSVEGPVLHSFYEGLTHCGTTQALATC